MNKQNYFKIFNLDTDYNLDLNELEQKYFALQRKFHPDKIGTKQQVSILDSSLVNIAYKTLYDPAKRAEYILSLLGINSQSEIEHDKKLIFEIMELKEQQSQLTNQVQINEFKKNIKQKIEKTQQELVALFDNKQYDTIKIVINRCKYFQKIIDDMKENYRL